MKGGDFMSMCCSSGKSHGTVNAVCPNLWSKQKKIRMLEKELEMSQEQTREIEKLISELKDE